MDSAIRWTVVMLGLAVTMVSQCSASDSEIVWDVDGLERVRILLNPSGADIGFENEVSGDNAAIVALVDVIKNASPGRDHKCGNIGALRFFLEDRSVRGVGLLPSHDEGRFDLRLYEGDGYVVVQVDLNRFREILGELGVPAGESIMVD